MLKSPLPWFRRCKQCHPCPPPIHCNNELQTTHIIIIFSRCIMPRQAPINIPGALPHYLPQLSSVEPSSATTTIGMIFVHRLVETTSKSSPYCRWTESIAVGSSSFIEETKREMGRAARGRKLDGQTDGACFLREEAESYTAGFDGKSEDLSSGNTIFWREEAVITVE